jgi:hypothetical protein
MGIQERIPDLSEKELESLQANALRLKDSGSAMQRQQAEELLPLLSAAIEERRTTRLATQAEARKASPRKKKLKDVEPES